MKNKIYPFFAALSLLMLPGLASAKSSQDVDIQQIALIPEEDVEEEADSLNVLSFHIDTTAPAYAIYKVWNNQDVNPYKICLLDMKDTVPVDMSGYCHPTHNVITSRFGFRRWKFHYGVDLRVKTGDPISCAFDGKVRIAKQGRAYGNYVVVRHYNGLETTYAHLSKILVKVNDEIKAGDLVGLGGNTGRSTGSHLHYEMRYLGEPIDPTSLINFETGSPYMADLKLTAEHFAYVADIQTIRTWTIRTGDTLWAISRRTGISIQRLCQLNNIKPTSILSIGQRLRYT
ncbi:MAG: peptidoglycan DD-metalloendopeptidase family protein [Prevotellaceae bacterium]|jgi:murein DD-endopeptidase MepM/ murein hydrolase activator NlpD|nr:peptidoglycan DD-metalloendopeptidase family protein [Prevotellaceae bacterium]